VSEDDVLTRIESLYYNDQLCVNLATAKNPYRALTQVIAASYASPRN
jgi:hypothetical protein